MCIKMFIKMFHVSSLVYVFTDSLVKGAEEVPVVMPTDVHSTAEPVQPVEQLNEDSTHQSDVEECKDISGKLLFSITQYIIVT